MPTEESVFVGNVGSQVALQDIRQLFEDNGAHVSNIDLKTGFAFVFCSPATDDISMDEIIAKCHGAIVLDRVVTVERSRGTSKIREQKRKESLVPSHTLFIVGLDPDRVRDSDVEGLFREFGTITKIDVKRNFAFVGFKEISEATRALEAYNNREVFGKTLFIEYSSTKPREYFDSSSSSRRNASSSSHSYPVESRSSRDADYQYERDYHHRPAVSHHSSSRSPTYAELQEELYRRRVWDEMMSRRMREDPYLPLDPSYLDRRPHGSGSSGRGGRSTSPPPSAAMPAGPHGYGYPRDYVPRDFRASPPRSNSYSTQPSSDAYYNNNSRDRESRRRDGGDDRVDRRSPIRRAPSPVRAYSRRSLSRDDDSYASRSRSRSR